jgi:hypothetical protein
LAFDVWKAETKTIPTPSDKVLTIEIKSEKDAYVAIKDVQSK